MSVSLRIINDDTIESLHSISSGQISEIQKIPNLFAAHNLYGDPDSAIDNQANRPSALQDRNIIDLGKRLRTLKKSIDAYKPGLLWRIINFITGKFFRLRRLQRCLPQVISVVDAVAQKTAFYQKHLAGKGDPDPVDSDDDDIVPTPQDDDDTFALPKAIASKNPKLAEKHKLITRAWKHITLEIAQYDDSAKKGMKITYNIAAAKKIENYFKTLLQQTMKGKEVALARFYHGSAVVNIPLIINSGFILQKPAAMGRGAFVSTNDEGSSYGPDVFGLDAEAVENTDAHYFSAHGRAMEGNLEPSVWICVKKDIPISPKTVACMTTTADRVATLTQDLQKRGKGWQNVPVFSREEALEMRTVLESVDFNRNLPSKRWFSLYGAGVANQLPKNMQHLAKAGKIVPTPGDWKQHG